jgi:hypothetical protein
MYAQTKSPRPSGIVGESGTASETLLPEADGDWRPSNERLGSGLALFREGNDEDDEDESDDGDNRCGDGPETLETEGEWEDDDSSLDAESLETEGEWEDDDSSLDDESLPDEKCSSNDWADEWEDDESVSSGLAWLDDSVSVPRLVT